ncbi:MAG: hypothetical protein GY842_12380 [bacterium]|nr:hypothetical protein [bacterium]
MRYHHPSRTRRIAKWTGLVVCVVVVVAWAVSLVITLGYGVPPWLFGIGEGAVAATHADSTGDEYADIRGFLFDGWVRPPVLLPSVNRRLCYTTMTVPLWIPLLPLSVGTAWLWCRDRKPPPGYCQRCGYDLTGNTSGVCPECGEGV